MVPVAFRVVTCRSSQAFTQFLAARWSPVHYRIVAVVQLRCSENKCLPKIQLDAAKKRVAVLMLGDYFLKEWALLLILGRFSRKRQFLARILTDVVNNGRPRMVSLHFCGDVWDILSTAKVPD